MQSSALLVGSTEKGIALLQTLIPPGTFENIQICQSSSEARRFSATLDWDLVVINTPLSDESGLDLAMELARSTVAGVLLLVKNDLADTVAGRVEECGVMVIPKPVSRAYFDQCMRMYRVMRGRLRALRTENERLEKKLNEQRLINRAKCVLIQYLGMTEEQAHRHIEKQAMDTRQTKSMVARNILAAYEM